MGESLSKQEQFLLEEYKAAAELTNHIDELRNKLTSFYLAFAGAAVAGMVLLLKGEFVTRLFGNEDTAIGILLLLVAVLGVPVVGGLARLRKVQIRYFSIINNIRSHIIGTDYVLWNVVQLSKQTLPKPNRRSGTYMWVLLVLFTSSSLFALSTYMLTLKLLPGVVSIKPSALDTAAVLAAIVAFFVALLVEDLFYFAWAKPRMSINYSKDNDPFNSLPDQPVPIVSTDTQ